MLQCAACGTENPDEFKFCENCGERIDQLPCPVCSHLNLRDMKFCEECGARLDVLACPSCSHENPRDFMFCEECGQALDGKFTQVAPQQANAPELTKSQPVVTDWQEQPVPQPNLQLVSSMKKTTVSRGKPHTPTTTIVVRQLPRKNSIWLFLMKTVVRTLGSSVIGFLVGKLGALAVSLVLGLF